jgi:hypothetical protein
MKRLQRITSLYLLLVLATIPLSTVARAQYGSPGGSGAQPQETPAAAGYDYIADAENEWVAESGAADAAGDWRYYRNPLYDTTHEEQAGWADGYCIQTVPGEWSYCSWSLYANTWTLSVNGIYNEATGDNWFAIDGGTGEYQDIHGYLRWASNEDSSQYYYTIEEHEYTYYEPLTVVANSEGWYSTYWYDPASSYANVRYFHDPIYDEAQSEQIGWSNGYCILTGPNVAAECKWTAWGDGWALTASGVKYDEGESRLSITGGWGDYAGATGYVTWQSSADGSQHYYTYTFDYLPATLYKPYEVYVEGSSYLYGDVPAVNDATGDVYYWHAPMWDAAQESKIGWSDGYCVIFVPDAWSTCTLTLHSDYWTLTASGPSYETGDASLMAVTGGTGAYGDVRGNIIVAPNEDASWYNISLDLYVAPTTYWQTVSWDQVAEEDHPDWYALGWNEYNWDLSHPAAIPASESRTWEQLTPYEQEAATALGYDESTWNSTAVRAPDGHPDDYWDAYDWEDLYFGEKRLFGIWGWDEHRWPEVPEASIPASTLRRWDELKAVEQGAATELGYTEETWNDHAVRTPEGNVEEYWSQYAWDELHYGECVLFAYLGWDEARWSGDQPIPESNYRTWEELSWVEKGAASQLGYDAESWDANVLEH